MESSSLTACSKPVLAKEGNEWTSIKFAPLKNRNAEAVSDLLGVIFVDICRCLILGFVFPSRYALIPS